MVRLLCAPAPQGVALPMLPLVLPPAVQALMAQAAPNQTPEQSARQAASLAAAVMSSPYSAMMLPPSIIPMGAPASAFPEHVQPNAAAGLVPMGALLLPLLPVSSSLYVHMGHGPRPTPP